MSSISKEDEVKLIKIQKKVDVVLMTQCIGINDQLTRDVVETSVESILDAEYDGWEVVCDESNNTPEVIDAHDLVVSWFVTTSSGYIFEANRSLRAATHYHMIRKDMKERLLERLQKYEDQIDLELRSNIIEEVLSELIDSVQPG